MKSIRNIYLFSALFLLSGCGYYEVNINGAMDTSRNYIVRPDASIAVLDDSKATDLSQEKEVKTKIEKLLKARGYVIGTILNSDYYVLFTYGIKNGQAESAIITNTNGSIGSPVQLKEATANRPDSDAGYRRWLKLKVVDGRYNRETNKMRYLWAEDVTSSGPNSNLREIIDYLLIPAIDHFCENTGTQLTVTISDGDTRTKVLTESK
jgi:hypothetical protein